MLYVAADKNVYDDGYGMGYSSAYGVDAQGRTYKLDPQTEAQLTQRYAQESRGRLPLGNAVARVTKAVGFQPCVPCAQRQATLNQLGDRIAKYWWAE